MYIRAHSVRPLFVSLSLRYLLAVMAVTHLRGAMQTRTMNTRIARRQGVVRPMRRCVAVHAAAQRQKFPSFDSMLRESNVPVLVDFYASWCGPCVMMNTELNKVSSTLKDEIKVVKVDTDKYPAIATKVRKRRMSYTCAHVSAYMNEATHR